MQPKLPCPEEARPESFINLLILLDIWIVDLSHDVLSPSGTSDLPRRWIAASTLGCIPLLLQPHLLPCNPSSNLLPVVLHEHTFAITTAKEAIKTADPRTTIDHSLAIDCLPHALGAAIPPP